MEGRRLGLSRVVFLAFVLFSCIVGLILGLYFGYADFSDADDSRATSPTDRDGNFAPNNPGLIPTPAPTIMTRRYLLEE